MKSESGNRVDIVYDSLGIRPFGGTVGQVVGLDDIIAWAFFGGLVVKRFIPCENAFEPLPKTRGVLHLATHESKSHSLAEFKETCPKCGQVITAKSEDVLKLEMALHLEWHEYHPSEK
jgi:hypothetical protein